MKLYGFWRSLATYRVKVGLALKGMKVDEVSIDLLKGMQHDKDYVAVNPQAVVPSLVLDEGGPPLSSRSRSSNTSRKPSRSRRSCRRIRAAGRAFAGFR
jgi:hypothetical protein